MARDNRRPSTAPAPAPSDVEPVSLTDDDETPPTPGDEGGPEVAPPPREADRVSKLEAELAEMKALIAKLATSPAAAASEAEQKAAEARLAAWDAEVGRGVQARSQDVANRTWPFGKFVWRCSLPDGNKHPELSIKADTATDALARYLEVIGVTSTEHKVHAEKA